MLQGLSRIIKNIWTCSETNFSTTYCNFSTFRVSFIIQTAPEQQNVWKTLPSVERLPGQHQNCIWKLERGHWLCWCNPCLWGWPAGGSSQGDLGWEGTLLLIISQSSSHQGHCWEAGKRQQLGVMVKPAGPRIAQILFLSGCWAAGIEGKKFFFVFRSLNFSEVDFSYFP